MVARVISMTPATMSRFASAPPDVASWAAKAGYSHVGLRVMTGIADGDHPMLPGRPMMRETKARLEGEGITPFEIEVARLDAHTDVAAFAPHLESASLLGGRHLVVIGDDVDLVRLTTNFAALCDLAAEYDLTVNLEATSYYVVNSISRARAIVDASGKSNAAVAPDPLHFHRVNDSLDDLRNLPHVNVLQFCDAPAKGSATPEERMVEARQERLPPGEGGLDLKSFVAALQPGLPVSVEVPMTRLLDDIGPVAVAARLLAATRKLLTEIDSVS